MPDRPVDTQTFARSCSMSMHHKIRLIAGAFVLLSLALAWWVHPAWLLFTAFVGANLIQSAFTRWCLMEDILVRTGIHPVPAPERQPEGRAKRVGGRVA